MDSRKTATATMRRKMARKSSLPLDPSGTLHSNTGLCRSETVQVVLDCAQGSGLCLGLQTPCGRGYVISQVIPDSVADR